MKVNRQIRAPKMRVIDKDGKQLGILTQQQAIAIAEANNLDLVEISPNAQPPVCKIIDYGKFRYEQAKKDKENKKTQHQVKVKEIKLKPNTDEHDLQFKLKHAREFIEKGNKVRITCMFRGREMAHPEVGRKAIRKLVDGLADIATPEAMPKQMGRNLSVIVAPGAKKTSVKKVEEKKIKENIHENKDETQKSS